MVRILSVAVLLCMALATASAQTAPPKLTAAQWQADLRFMTERLVRQHPNAYRRVKQADFEAAVNQFYDRIPTLTENEIITGFMRIVAMVRDGHTNFVPHSHFRSGMFPVQFYVFSDGLFVRSAAPKYRDLAGGKLVRIGDTPVDEALKRVSELAFSDNEMGQKQLGPFLLSLPEALARLKINPGGQPLKLTVQVGTEQKTVEIAPDPALTPQPMTPADWISADGGTAKPLYLRHTGELYWFEYDQAHKLLYVQQNAVQNKPDEALAAFYGRALEFANANPVEKIVIDLRNNGGGNNGLNRPPVIALIKSKWDVPGRLFVITGRATFSAAQNFVNEFEKYTTAIFVGEPTAAHPNAYGDNRPITLPNSKIDVRVSTLYWQDMDPRDERTWTAPQIAAEVSSEDFRLGRDPVVEAVINYVPGSSFAELLNEAQSQTDIRAFLTKYRTFKADPTHRFVETEGPLNRLGYALLQNKRAADALEVFKLNADSFPRSANAFDSLGDGYQAVGNRELAIQSYEKALAIDPNFASSLASLNRLKPQR
jgi:tetratricopeptide (TPR) repeat protein